MIKKIPGNSNKVSVVIANTISLKALVCPYVLTLKLDGKETELWVLPGEYSETDLIKESVSLVMFRKIKTLMGTMSVEEYHNLIVMESEGTLPESVEEVSDMLRQSREN